MTDQRMKAITLFDAAWVAMGLNQPCGRRWHPASRWSFVPNMLAWLQDRGDIDVSWRDGEGWCTTSWPDGTGVSAEGADMPTALAKLVVEVRTCEQGGKP